MQHLSNLAKNTAITLSWKGSIERAVAEIVLNDKVDLQFNDARLNKIAMNTWNIGTCKEVFNVINKVLNPIEYNWKPLLNALLALRTIIYYGSEKAIDLAIELCPVVYKLQDYNSALQKNSRGVPRGGQDYGAPIREEAQLLYNILQDDNEIRNARDKARGQNGDMLVPIGDKPKEPEAKQCLQFGMGAAAAAQSVSGATFSLNNVPNLYQGRPERYFDSQNDPRRRPEGDAIPDFSTWNVTDMVGAAGVGGLDPVEEEKKSTTSDLLDLVFNSSEPINPNLPDADYLPAMQKQKELERQLALQQEQLKMLQQQQQQQQQQQLPNNNVNMSMGMGMGMGIPPQNMMMPNNNVNMSMGMGMGMGIPPQNMMMSSFPLQQQQLPSMLAPQMVVPMQLQPQLEQQPTAPIGGVFDNLVAIQHQQPLTNNTYVNEIGMPPPIQAPVSSDPFAAIRNLSNNANDQVPTHAPPPPPSAPASFL